MTVKVLPAIVAVPVRWVVPLFAATVTATVPLPEPLLPPRVSQAAELVAVQAQPLCAVTATLVDSPAAADARVAGAIE